MLACDRSAGVREARNRFAASAISRAERSEATIAETRSIAKPNGSSNLGEQNRRMVPPLQTEELYTNRRRQSPVISRSHQSRVRRHQLPVTSHEPTVDRLAWRLPVLHGEEQRHGPAVLWH